MHWDYGWDAGMGWMMATASIFWIIMIGGLVWLAVKGIARTTGPGESPETILKSRYARGDIDREEYERRLADIRK